MTTGFPKFLYHMIFVVHKYCLPHISILKSTANAEPNDEFTNEKLRTLELNTHAQIFCYTYCNEESLLLHWSSSKANYFAGLTTFGTAAFNKLQMRLHAW